MIAKVGMGWGGVCIGWGGVLVKCISDTDG